MDVIQFFKGLSKGEIKGIYLLYGREELLKREAVDRIKKLIIPADFENLNFTFLDGELVTAGDIINAVETLPFMGGKRLVFVRDINLSARGKRKLSREDIDILEKYLSDIPDYSCLVMKTAGNVDMRTRIMKIIKKNGDIVEFDRLKRSHFVKWCKNQIEKRGKSIDTEQLGRFIDVTGYLERGSPKTLDDIVNEIEKLVGYCRGRKVILEEDIEAVAPRSLKTDIFKLVDAIGDRDSSQALALVEDMKLAREPALKVMFMITRQFRLLLQVYCLKSTGYSSRAIASRLGLQPFIVNSLLKQSSNFSIEELKHTLINLSRYDVRIKQGKIDAWLAIEMFVAQLDNK